jgi:hypothetical protein
VWQKIAPRLKRGAFFYVLLAFLAGGSLRVGAQSITLREDEDRPLPDWTVVPYGFYSGSFGVGLGLGAGYTGRFQEQSTLLGTVAWGSRDAYIIAGGATHVQGHFSRRLFYNPIFSFARYSDDRIFINGNPYFPDEIAGSNDSSGDNYIVKSQWDNWAEFKTHYVLPIGQGRDTIISRYKLNRGILAEGASGGDVWNPLVSGRTHITFAPRWREMTLDYEGDEDLEFSTFNLRLGIEYDNRDYPMNPSRGSFQKITYTRDGERIDEANAWQVVEGQWAWFVDLPEADWMRQQVLVLEVWTADTPSWDTETVAGLDVPKGRTPFFEGATLGGFYRMRGFEGSRFHDRSAICYSLEYRVIPDWNPLGEIPALGLFKIDWWQWVFFAEAGRVAPEWDIETLHEDMKVDAGISLRAMILKAVCRVDVAVSGEGMRVSAMYGHPF